MPRDSKIHACARAGDLRGVLAELAAGVALDLRDPENDHTPLMEAVAAETASIDLVRELIRRGADVNAVTTTSKNVLSLALWRGVAEIIRLLIDSGATVAYQRSHGYDALLDVMHGRLSSHDPQLVPIIRLLIDRDAALNTVTSYGESAMRSASRVGRFDAVRALLSAGAEADCLEWTPLMHAVVYSSLTDVKRELQGADLAARDCWSRTAWLLSLQVGDVAKAKLLLASGADRNDRGRCGKLPLMYAIQNRHAELLRWLIGEKFRLNDTDEHGNTALMAAAEAGETECVKILLDAGADPHVRSRDEPALTKASNLDIVRLLVRAGADLNDISEAMRAKLTGLSIDEAPVVAQADYLTGRRPRFGQANPERMNVPFMNAMVKCGAIAHQARRQFDDSDKVDSPVWCFRRFGKSITELPDGRIIEIGGEHEDFYDPDFYIYNDVVVHQGGGRFEIYGYPRSVFPPTDFHSATLVGKFIYVIGRIGYSEERTVGRTQISRLNTQTLSMEEVETTGDSPSWIHHHTARLQGEAAIRITGGKTLQGGEIKDNTEAFLLDLRTLSWRKIEAEQSG